MLETWGCGILLDIAPFEQLVKDGVERYVASVERYVASVERYERVALKKRRKGTEKIEGNDEVVLDLSWI